MFLGFGKGLRDPKPLIYIVFGPSERGKGPNTPCFGAFGKGPGAFGKGPGAQNPISYKVFGPPERGQGPKTLYFIRFLGRRRGARGPKPCILQGFWAVGKGPGAQHLVFYKVFGTKKRLGMKPSKTFQNLPKRSKTFQNVPKRSKTNVFFC